MLLNPGASLFDALQREFDFSRRVWSPPTPPASPRSHSEYLSALLFPPLLKRQSSGRRFFAQPDSTTTADLGDLNPVETFPQLSITDNSNNNNNTTPKKASNFVVPNTVKSQSQSLQSRKIQKTKKRPAPTRSPPIVINVEDDSEDEGIDLQDPEFEEIAPERKQPKMLLPSPLDASEKVTGRPVLTTTIVESTTPDTDVEDTEDTSVPSEVRFELDTVLPQFDRSDVSVNVVTTHHNKLATPTLVIRAKRQSEDHSDVEEYHRRVKLPVGVAVNQLSHSFNPATGVLHVEAPVVVEKSRPKTTSPDVEWIEVNNNTTQPEVTSSRPAARLTHRREEILLD